VIGLNRAMRERLWERVAGMPGRAPKGIPIKKPNAQWIRPGLVGHVRFLKGLAKFYVRRRPTFLQ
jgi:ATP-dependent DNA ligase